MAEPERPAFYALAPGGWRDYWTLLHPPYTLWHLAHVAIGAATAPRLDPRWLAEALLAFFLGLGVAAHALDELRGRPLRTRIPDAVLWALAGAGTGGAVALGIHGAVLVSPWLLVFIVVGVFLLPAYNLELFGGRFHTDLWFGLAWGAFPVLAGAFVQAGTLTAPALVAGTACAVLAGAQRRLSAPVRRLRRRVAEVRGELRLADGTVEALDAAALRRAPEGALRLLSVAVPLLAAALVAARWP